jgi:hypothetical protein
MRSLLACCAILLTTVIIAAPATQAEGEQPPGSGKITLDQRFLGRYIGTAKDTRYGQGSRIAIDIVPGDKKGYVQLKMQAWQDLVGSLIGEISTAGQLRASGIISELPKPFYESRAWDCNLRGMIRETTFEGTYSCFPKTVTGRNCSQLPGYPCPRTDEMEGSFDLKKFKPLVKSK